MNKQYNNFKLSLILLIPFGSLIGISILFNVYNDYLKMAASQYNYDYLYISMHCTFISMPSFKISWVNAFATIGTIYFFINFSNSCFTNIFTMIISKSFSCSCIGHFIFHFFLFQHIQMVTCRSVF